MDALESDWSGCLGILYCIVLISPAFLIKSWPNLGWIVIIALGLAFQNYLYQRFSSPTERTQIRQMGLVLLVAMAVYFGVWLLDKFLPTSALSNAGWVWFYILA